MMKNVDEVFREALDVKSSLPENIDITDDTQGGTVHILRNLYRNILLTDLDYALDKKIEQDLWNVCFKLPISRLQTTKTTRKTLNPLLGWFLEGSSGFYLVLLQEIYAQCNYDNGLCKRNAELGIFSAPSYSLKPKKESFLYICQHCLIHLGDIARYRNLIEEAEDYYKQAASVEPSSGHPYNQLALLQSVKGDGLSTLYYYIRSLSLRHPFPPAKSNLDKLLKKLSILSKPKGRSPEELINVFLKLQGQIGLGCDLDQAEQTLHLLGATLPSLIATEAFQAAQLNKALAITLHLVDECTEKRSFNLAISLIGMFLNASLTACCALSIEQLLQSKYLATVKLVLDYVFTRSEHLEHLKKSVWVSLAKLLNQLQLCLDVNKEVDDGKPLPEDIELLGFKPLKQAYRWNSLVMTNSTEVRALRIIKRGQWLAEREILAIENRKEEPKMLFSSSMPIVEDEVISKSTFNQEPVKEIKILARPPQRNVALAAIFNKQMEQVKAPEVEVKQVTFQKQPLISFPRPPLLRPEVQQESKNHGWYSNFGNTMPDLSVPPPTVPPPGLGFPPPPPPPSWNAIIPPPTAPPYSLFNSSWHPAQLPSFAPAAAPERPVQVGPASLWSGPGPSPLERLLEQQKAMRGVMSSPGKK